MTLGDIKKLNQLDGGMSQSQVREILGEPQQKELKAGKTVLKYSLHGWMRGWKPVYLVFDESGALQEWYVNEEEYIQMQKLWVEAFKFTKPHKED